MLLTPLLTRRRTRVLAAFASVAALVVLGVTPVQAIPAQAEDPPPQVLLLMDASGSMKEPDPSGSSKMDAAKKALDGVIQEMPDSAEVGLRVYGATEAGGEPTPAACADTQLVAPIAEMDRATLGAAVEGFQAKGETPIAHSLEQAAADFSGDGAKRIILVSDGEESCVPDPCPQVESLAAQDIDLTIDIVGLAVDAAAKDQLSCLTEATGGTYYDAADAGELADGLQVLTQRAVRDFTFSGTPTKGGNAPGSATRLTPGSHTTTLAPDKSPTFFRVDRRDHTLNFTVTVAPPKSTGGGGQRRLPSQPRRLTAQTAAATSRPSSAPAAPATRSFPPSSASTPSISRDSILPEASASTPKNWCSQWSATPTPASMLTP